MKTITSFFHLCSGSSSLIINRFPTERSRYAGIGATIFFTGILAAIAAGYALYTIFENGYVATGFGIIWGLMIFNLDRYIVSSMRKTSSRTSTWLMATPRLLLAILIAIVISRPLELRIFEKEINNELIIMEQEMRMEQDSAVRSRYSPSIIALQNDIDKYKSELNTQTIKRDALLEEARKEADGTGGTGQRNAGPIYKLKKKDADQASEELSQLKITNEQLIAERQITIDSLQKSISNEISGYSSTQYDGLANRLEAMSRITAGSSTIQFAEWFIILLFIAIECAPILVKIISPKGPYDDRLQVHEHQSHVLRTILMAKNSSDVRESTDGMSTYEKEWLDTELTKSLAKK